MKKNLIVLFVLSFSLAVNAVNVTIIESKTANYWAVQDTVWRSVAVDMGYSATIVQQSALDDISNFTTADVLIVASATISFSKTNHLQTIRQFVLSGRSVYIQSDYLVTMQGNITFDSLMHTVGADFNWTESISGGTFNVIGKFATTPKNVPTLNISDYGMLGTGTGVDKILEYDGNYMGFCYFDSNGSNGTIITIGDEDWCHKKISLVLMGNILYRLAQKNPNSIKNFKKNSSLINIFPNHNFNGKRLLFGSNLNNATLTVYNSIGIQINQISNISGREIVLRRNSLSSGVYFVKLTQNKTAVETGKLIIRK